jgi:hypothetical protein
VLEDVVGLEVTIGEAGEPEVGGVDVEGEDVAVVAGSPVVGGEDDVALVAGVEVVGAPVVDGTVAATVELVVLGWLVVEVEPGTVVDGAVWHGWSAPEYETLKAGLSEATITIDHASVIVLSGFPKLYWKLEPVNT